MAGIFDFKKEYKELYLPKTTPSIVDVPKYSLSWWAAKGIQTHLKHIKMP